MGRGGYIGGSTFRFLRRQEPWRGQRAIERPEQPERSAADEAWLARNDKPPRDRRAVQQQE
jgi:hypothetical protein